MSDAQEPIRLFVGGLPDAVTSQQLTGRFTSFGSVSAVVLVPNKLQNSSTGCRGFAYVSFTPKDDMALQRCLSLYNGCKWLGGILRVEKAREHYLSKLQREWQKQPEEPSTTDPDVEPDSAEAMRIPTPASGFIKRKLMTVQANKVKHIFAPIKGKQLSVLSWDPPPDPPGVLKRKAAEQAVAEYSKKLCTLPPPPPLPAQPHSQPASDSVPQSNLPSGEASAPAGVQHTDAQQSQQQQQQQRGKAGVRADSEVRAQDASQRSDAVDMQEADVQPESSSDAGVVDFMSDDDDAESAQGPPMQAPGDVSSKHDNAQQSMHANGVAARQEATDLSRFGSDSEDGGDTDQPAGTAAVSNVAKGTNLSRFDSDDEQSALAADGFGADTTAAQQAIAPVNTSKRITDLSAFDSEDEQANSADAGADAVPSAAQQRGAGAAGSEARDTDLSRFDSGDDSSEDDDKPADTAAERYSTSEDDAPSSSDSDLKAATAELQTDSPAGPAQKAAADGNAAVASQRAAPAAVQSAPSPQLSHQAARKQQAGSQSDTDSPPDEAGEVTSSSEQSEAVQPGHLSDRPRAGQPRPLNANLPHLQDAAAVLHAQPVQGSIPREHSQPVATQQPTAASFAQSSELSSAEMSSSEGADLSPQSDEEEQSSEPSTTLEPAQAQHDQNCHHDSEHEPDHGQDVAQPEVSNSHAADVAASSTSGSDATGSDLDSIAEGVAQLNPESMLQAAAHPAQEHQEEAPLYSDLSALKFGASFWQQHGGLSQKEWQAQRQALQTDYRAKRRAATKHTHRTRKAARS